MLSLGWGGLWQPHHCQSAGGSQGDSTIFAWALESRSYGKAGVKTGTTQSWRNLTKPQKRSSLNTGPAFGPGSLTKAFCCSSGLHS